jgi:hypothetical protein
MKRIRLIHWNTSEATERAALLQAAGYAVVLDLPPGPALMRQLRNETYDAFVIDLSRLPSQGRDIALNLRSFKATRHTPLVFVGGDPAKVAPIARLLPDAVYAAWGEIAGALQQVIAHPPANPVTFKSGFDAYAGRPLATKLGIKKGSVLTLVDAPPTFRDSLGELPEGVEFRERTEPTCTLIIWFVTTQQVMQQGIAAMAANVQTGSLWIAWPKRGGGVASDLTQQMVRDAGLAIGLVDYKVCSIDATWTGLLFSRRKAKT